ncbi:sensor histidine kinase [Porphyromonas gingivalis]|uniref:sensor histidine kinase n=1 Tax=Porphyromonas gingivalis TaxID=837 RepID=UPI00036B382B|nr:PAS domain-containing sensor histidine kinase [Porphyromonas gingivalis]ATS01534.1 ATP-binding protein [Porphyromonas gingivalis]EOA09706.1 GHKL domain protein [Porphyromonas gingivalis JCVI SC001]PDP55765.1 ATP-binding protein [Porphyromonas gingivalis]
MKRLGRISLRVLLLAGVLLSLLLMAMTLLYPPVEKGGLFFMLAIEVVLLFFLGFLYNKVVLPIRAVGDGMDMLRSQDYATTLAPVGQPDADRVVELYNALMHSLKKERLRLEERDNFLSLVMDVSPVGFVVLDFDMRVVSVNPAARRLLDLPDDYIPIERPLEEVCAKITFGPDELGEGESRTWRLPTAEVRRITRMRFFDRSFSRLFFSIETLTEELHSAEKEAYEKLIRLIAHEINNSTAGIIGVLNAVGDAFDDTPHTPEGEVSEAIALCRDRCMAMSRFITRFAEVVKLPDPTLSSVDLVPLCERCILLMQPLAVETGVKMKMCKEQDSCLVRCDAEQIEQVVINLLRNAIESFAQQNDLAVSATKTVLLCLDRHNLLVEDNGQPISDDVATRLFTPFFSTKPNGQGIGLVVIREVLTRHGWSFSLTTDADGRTRFRMAWP